MNTKLLLASMAIIAILATGEAIVWNQYASESMKIFAFCGAASTPVLEVAAQAYEEKTGTKVELTFGGSGTVLSSMEISKMGDLFIPGSPDYMSKAINDGVVYPETVRMIAYLIPAIIVSKGNPKNIRGIEDLAKPGLRVGIGDPESVCVGLYAKELLEHNDLWDEVEENIVTYAASCSKAAALASLGQVDAIMGWDVFYSWPPEKVDIVYIDPDKIPRIAYVPGAVSIYTQDRSEAQGFLDFLLSLEGREIWAKYGYIASEEEAREFAPEAEIPEI